MQSEYLHCIADLCERDREAFLSKIRFGIATSTEIAFYAADELCPESRWREFALDEEECIRKGLACNSKVTIEYLKSLQLAATDIEAEWLQELIKFRSDLERLPDLDGKVRPRIVISGKFA
jgi:hypothetical protein